MKEIEFHFNVPDKLQYSCRLLRKVYLRGMRAVVTGETPVLAELDQLLWTFSPTGFLPHCMATASAPSLAVTPILLVQQPDQYPVDGVLINLGPQIPAGFERFERFIELVSGQPDDRLAGRSRWKTYKDGGFELKRHDLAASGEAA
ncbi:MAG: DNA polymerase III subunit chi [Pseudomonadota bacterium]